MSGQSVHRQPWTPAGSATRRHMLGSSAPVAAALGIAACGVGSPAGVGPAKEPKDLKGKIVFYARGGEVETKGQAEIFIPTFASVAPNVKVEHAVFAKSAPDETYATKLYAMQSSGDPPDVWGFGLNYYAYWARGMCADLTPYIARDRFDLGQFLKGLPEIFRIKGKQYGLPQLTTLGTLLFYNQKLFDEAGLKRPPVDWEDRSWTVDAMLEAAGKLTKDAGETTAVYGLAFFPEMPHNGAWMWGGDAYLPEHYKDSIAPATKLDSQESIAVHQFVQDLRWKYHYTQRKGDPPVNQPGRGAFQAGRLAMNVSPGWTFWLNSVIEDFPWAAAALPIKASNKNANFNDFWIMSRQSKNPDAAWAFLRHLTSADVQARYSDLTGTPPTNRDAMDAWYRKYERFMPRADLEKVTQGAIDTKRSVENPDHTFLDYPRIDEAYVREVENPLLNNEGAAREVIAKAKPVVDSLVKEIHDQWKGKLPS